MKIVNINNSENLTNEFGRFTKSNNYIFRGQPDKKYLLTPSAFRIDTIKKLAQAFPNHDCQNWIISENLKEFLELYVYKLKIQKLFIMRMFQLNLYLFQLNYFLAKHIEQSQLKYDQKTMSMIKLKPSEYYLKEDNFVIFFKTQVDRAIGCITLDGQLLKETIFSEILSSYEESLPQHYGAPTTMLDWSKNIYVAVYFAMQNIPDNATHFSLFAYREISKNPNNSIEIYYGDPDVFNLRKERQSGLFIRMKYACPYFIYSNSWPTMESFLPSIKGNFELIRYDFPVSCTKYLLNFLEKKGITKDYLLPDADVADRIIW